MKWHLSAISRRTNPRTNPGIDERTHRFDERTCESDERTRHFANEPEGQLVADCRQKRWLPVSCGFVVRQARVLPATSEPGKARVADRTREGLTHCLALCYYSYSRRVPSGRCYRAPAARLDRHERRWQIGPSACWLCSPVDARRCRGQSLADREGDRVETGR